MIDINTAANIAEIGGGIAILVSLIYVGYQIRQSNRLASASALQSVLGEYLDRNANNDPESSALFNRAVLSWRDLSVEEKQQFHIMMTKIILHMQNIMQLHDNRLLDDVDFNTWLSWTTSHMRSPGGKDWWEDTKCSYTPTVVSTLDKFLAENESAPSYLDLFPWLFEENTK
jgi:hypothetical protein